MSASMITTLRLISANAIPRLQVTVVLPSDGMELVTAMIPGPVPS